MSSGTQRLSPALHAVTRAGGNVRALIGVDNGLTSMQAVADLHAAGVEVLGFHTGGSILYHPKVYLLSSADRAWISVGSSNLTGDGMYRNVETNTVIELDLAVDVEKHVLDETLAWFEYFQNIYRRNTIRITPESIQDLVRSRILANEIEIARETRATIEPGTAPRRGALDDRPPRIAVPALPTATGYRPVRRRVRRGAIPREEDSAVAPTTQTRFFAMTLSAHDASKRTGGMPGTPEFSLPRSARGFFPRMRVAAHEYPDAYFDVRLNDGPDANTVTYRIWERPAGGRTGHADLRINPKRETVDLTTAGGGDLVLFEVSPDAVGPAYEVWIIKPTDPNYNSILARCTHAVAARGGGAGKRFGFF
jgi:hypothetical protein